MPTDLTLIPDSVMRPWTIDDVLDGKIEEEISALDETLTKISPQAAIRGRSVLDIKPEQLILFEQMVAADPNWINNAVAALEEMEGMTSAINNDGLVSMNEGKIVGESENGENSASVSNENNNDSLRQSKLLMRTLLELNAALKQKENASKSTSKKKTESNKQITQFLRLTGTKNNRKPTLSAIKYKPRSGPAVFNISTAEFQRFMLKQGIKLSDSSQTSTKRTMPTAKELAELKSLTESKMLERWAATNLDLLAPESNDTSESYDSAPVASSPLSFGVATSPMNNLVTATAVSTATKEKEKEKDPSIDSNSSNVDSNNFNFNNNNERVGLQLPVSPIISRVAPLSPDTNARASSSRGERLMTTSKSMSDLPPLSPKTSLMPGIQSGSVRATPSIHLDAPSSGGIHFRPSTAPVAAVGGSRGSTPRMNKSASASESISRFDQPRINSPALDKLGISGRSGTANSLFAKCRIKEVKKFRDQLMTTAGSLAMNVHPESNPDNVKDALASMELTKKMCIETIEKNRIDQTWTLLSTPGYYEAVGPEKAFKSECHMFHTTNAAFEKAVRDVDVSLGIHKDPLRVWSESAVKNNVKIFTSGGAMRI